MESNVAGYLKTDTKEGVFVDSHVSKFTDAGTHLESRVLPDKPKANIDTFLSMFESWNDQNVSIKSEGSELAQKLEIAETKKRNAEARISDLESTVTCLQSNIDSLHNDLDLVDKLHTENQELKQKLSDEDKRYETLQKSSEDKLKALESEIKYNQGQYDKELLEVHEETKRKVEKIDSEMIERLQEKDAEIEKIRKAKQSEVSLLTIDYEDRISKLQRQKVAVTMNQQQQSSNSQEIFRRKLQHLKLEYEEKMSSLKNQVSHLQSQLRQDVNRDSTQNRVMMSSNNQPAGKRMRRY